MSVLVTCKFDEDLIHSNWEKVEISFSPLPEDWFCIIYLSAEDMLKSAVIQEKKFKHRGRQPIRAKNFMSTGRLYHYGHLLQV